MTSLKFLIPWSLVFLLFSSINSASQLPQKFAALFAEQRAKESPLQHELEHLYRSSNKFLTTLRGSEKSGFRLGFDIFLVFDSCMNNAVILSQMLDTILYDQIFYVGKVKNPGFTFSDLQSLYSMNFQPTRLYQSKLSARHVALNFYAQKISDREFRTWYIRLLAVQKEVLAQLKTQIETDSLPNPASSSNLYDFIGIPQYFVQFLEEFCPEYLKGISVIQQVQKIFMEFLMLKSMLLYKDNTEIDYGAVVPPDSILNAYLWYNRGVFDHINRATIFQFGVRGRQVMAPFWHNAKVQETFGIKAFVTYTGYLLPDIQELASQIISRLNFAVHSLQTGSLINDLRWHGRGTVIAGIALLESTVSVDSQIHSVGAETMIVASEVIRFLIDRSSSKNKTADLLSDLDQLERVSLDKMIECVARIEKDCVDYMLLNPLNRWWMSVFMELFCLGASISQKFLNELPSVPITKGISGFSYGLLLKAPVSFSSVRKPPSDKRIYEDLSVHLKKTRLELSQKPEPEPIFPVFPAEDLDKLVEELEGPKPKAKPRKARKAPKPKNEPEIPKVDEDWDSHSQGESLESDTSVKADDDSHTLENAQDSIEERPSSTEATSSSIVTESVAISPPVQALILIESEDFKLVSKIDSRLLAYSYLMIGNFVFTHYLLGLFGSLANSGIYLYGVFLKSVSDFEDEIRLLSFTEPDLFSSVLEECGMEDLEFVLGCLSFYKKRLRVAHQFISKLGMKKRLMANIHMSTLMRCNHSAYGSGTELVKDSPGFHWSASRRVSLAPLIFESNDTPSAEEIEYELAILGLYGMFRTDKLASMCGGIEAVDLKPKRHPIAHRSPSKAELSAYIQLYIGTQPETFLKRLLN